MKVKGKKFIVGAALCAVGVIGLFGMFTETDSRGALLAGSLVLIAAGVVLFVLDKKFPNIQKSSEPVKPNIHTNAAELRQNNEYFDFRVAGVTFSNGRKTRQAILRKIHFGDEPFDGLIDWTLKQYDYEGETAVGVYANGEQVGNVPKEHLPYILENFDRIKSVYHANVSGGGTDDDGETIPFGCKITLSLRK